MIELSAMKLFTYLVLAFTAGMLAGAAICWRGFQVSLQELKPKSEDPAGSTKP